MKLENALMIYTKSTQNAIKAYMPETIKLLEENIGCTLCEVLSGLSNTNTR